VPPLLKLTDSENLSRRFRTVCTGRRFGKTLCLAAELLDRGGCELAGDYGWVAPTYNVAERGIEAFRDIADGFIRVVGRMPTRVEFEGAAGLVRVWFLSADNSDAIRGYGFKGLVIDEAAVIPADVWHYVLRPTIAQTLGWAVFVSTPKGRNWFYDLFPLRRLCRCLSPGLFCSRTVVRINLILLGLVFRLLGWRECLPLLLGKPKRIGNATRDEGEQYEGRDLNAPFCVVHWNHPMRM